MVEPVFDGKLLSDMKYREKQKLLKTLNLSARGSDAEMTERLKDYYYAHNNNNNLNNSSKSSRSRNGTKKTVIEDNNTSISSSTRSSRRGTRDNNPSNDNISATEDSLVNAKARAKEDVSSPVRRSSRSRKSSEGDENYTQIDANADASSASGKSDSDTNGNGRPIRNKTRKTESAATTFPSSSVSNNSNSNNTQAMPSTKANARTKAASGKEEKQSGRSSSRSTRARGTHKSPSKEVEIELVEDEDDEDEDEDEDDVETSSSSTKDFDPSRRISRNNSPLKSTASQSETETSTVETNTIRARNNRSSRNTNASNSSTVPSQAPAEMAVDTEEPVAELGVSDREMLREMLSDLSQDKEEQAVDMEAEEEEDLDDDNDDEKQKTKVVEKVEPPTTPVEEGGIDRALLQKKMMDHFSGKQKLTDIELQGVMMLLQQTAPPLIAPAISSALSGNNSNGRRSSWGSVDKGATPPSRQSQSQVSSQPSKEELRQHLSFGLGPGMPSSSMKTITAASTPAPASMGIPMSMDTGMGSSRKRSLAEIQWTEGGINVDAPQMQRRRISFGADVSSNSSPLPMQIPQNQMQLQMYPHQHQQHQQVAVLKAAMIPIRGARGAGLGFLNNLQTATTTPRAGIVKPFTAPQSTATTPRAGIVKPFTAPRRYPATTMKSNALKPSSRRFFQANGGISARRFSLGGAGLHRGVQGGLSALPLPLPPSAGTGHNTTSSPYKAAEPQKLKNVEAAAHSIVAARILDTLNNVMPSTADQNSGEKLAIENSYSGNRDEGVAGNLGGMKENGHFAANQQTMNSRGYGKSTNVHFAIPGKVTEDGSSATMASKKIQSNKADMSDSDAFSSSTISQFNSGSKTSKSTSFASSMSGGRDFHGQQSKKSTVSFEVSTMDTSPFDMRLKSNEFKDSNEASSLMHTPSDGNKKAKTKKSKRTATPGVRRTYGDDAFSFADPEPIGGEIESLEEEDEEDEEYTMHGSGAASGKTSFGGYNDAELDSTTNVIERDDALPINYIFSPPLSKEARAERRRSSMDYYANLENNSALSNSPKTDIKASSSKSDTDSYLKSNTSKTSAVSDANLSSNANSASSGKNSLQALWAKKKQQKQCPVCLSMNAKTAVKCASCEADMGGNGDNTTSTVSSSSFSSNTSDGSNNASSNKGGSGSGSFTFGSEGPSTGASSSNFTFGVQSANTTTSAGLALTFGSSTSAASATDTKAISGGFSYGSTKNDAISTTAPSTVATAGTGTSFGSAPAPATSGFTFGSSSTSVDTSQVNNFDSMGTSTMWGSASVPETKKSDSPGDKKPFGSGFGSSDSSSISTSAPPVSSAHSFGAGTTTTQEKEKEVEVDTNTSTSASFVAGGFGGSSFNFYNKSQSVNNSDAPVVPSSGLSFGANATSTTSTSEDNKDKQVTGGFGFGASTSTTSSSGSGYPFGGGSSNSGSSAPSASSEPTIVGFGGKRTSDDDDAPSSKRKSFGGDSTESTFGSNANSGIGKSAGSSFVFGGTPVGGAGDVGSISKPANLFDAPVSDAADSKSKNGAGERRPSIASDSPGSTMEMGYGSGSDLSLGSGDNQKSITQPAFGSSAITIPAPATTSFGAGVGSSFGGVPSASSSSQPEKNGGFTFGISNGANIANSSSQPATSFGFGSSSAAPASQSSFGAPIQQQQQQGSTSFGTVPAATSFGGATNTSSFGGFGSQTNSTPTPGGFGALAPASSGGFGGFGGFGSNTNVAPGGFGAPSAGAGGGGGFSFGAADNKGSAPAGRTKKRANVKKLLGRQ